MLNPEVLKSGLRPLFQQDGMPEAGVIEAWCRAYVPYAQMANAGLTSPSPLSPVAFGGEFADALDASLRAMWMSVAWAGLGVIGTTAVVPALQPFLRSPSGALSNSFDRERGLSLITEAVYTYTLSIVVTVVPPGGTPTTMPLS